MLKNKDKFIIIGGAEDKEQGKEILKRVCDNLKLETGEIIIATVASEYPNEVLQKYINVFKKLNVNKIRGLFINNREDSYKEENSVMISKADVIFFTGGDQLRITSMIGGTPVYDALSEAITKGVTVVGTSAGASVMSETMVVEGQDEESPKKCTIEMSAGLGFVKDVIIDQHFAQRGRIGRLLAGIAQNPQILGIGIDEDTAIVVNNEGVLEIIGNGAVYFIDGREISFTNVSEQNAEELLSIHNVKLHILKSGDKFDLNKKIPFKEE